MIGVFRAYAFRPRRTPTYTRRRRVRARKTVDRVVTKRDTVVVLFDRSYELPRATLQAHNTADQLGALRGWFTARWTWFRPRMLPVMVALVGAIALLESGRYLSDMASGRIAATLPAHHVAADTGSSTPGSHTPGSYTR